MLSLPMTRSWLLRLKFHKALKGSPRQARIKTLLGKRGGFFLAIIKVMKIATWNIERLKHSKKLDVMLAKIGKVNADILVLTETDTRVNPDYPFKVSTNILPTDNYKSTERRCSVFSKFEIIGSYETYDGLTTICPEVRTPFGNLLVYSTIIGVYGNRHPSFKEDLEKQLADFKRLGKRPLCIVGDFNLSFSDNYYFTNAGRNALNSSLAENGLINLTADLNETIDHICLSKHFLGDRNVELLEWNQDKSLSDHEGVCVSIH